jgi:rubrerythrin
VAASVLAIDEYPVLSSECKWKILEQSDGQKGTLFLTSMNRLVFVTSLGLLSKKFKKSHTISISDVINVRIEERFLGRCLVVEWNCEGTFLTYRYEGVQNIEAWVSKMVELIKAAREIDEAYDRVIRLIKSKETTTFDEIEEIIASVQPEFGKKSQQEKNQNIIDFLSRCIDQRIIEGFIDVNNRCFTHLTAYKQKSVRREREVIKTVVMIPCKYCGALMPDTSLFCPNCGAKKSM